LSNHGLSCVCREWPSGVERRGLLAKTAGNDQLEEASVKLAALSGTELGVEGDWYQYVCGG
jgi:hypothetical protein